MAAHIILIIYGAFLILGGFLGFRKGSKVSLVAGVLSGILVFIGVWALGFAPQTAWAFLACLNALLSLSFISRLMKTRKFMPSGMLLLLAAGVCVFSLAHLFHA